MAGCLDEFPLIVQAKALDRCISHQGDQAKEMGLALRSKQQREIADISSR